MVAFLPSNAFAGDLTHAEPGSADLGSTVPGSASRDSASHDSAGHDSAHRAAAPHGATELPLPRTASRRRVPDTEAFRPGALADLGTPSASERISRSAFARPETKPHPAPVAADEWMHARSVAVWSPGRAHPGAKPHEGRMLADSTDRDAWLRARAAGVTATDAAKLATPNSVRQVVRDKLEPNGFSGNAYTEHGRQREPHIAAWVLERHGIPACGMLYHADRSLRHLATPDGLYADDDRVLLAEIKTTGKPWNRIPRAYMRQVYWQQYVLGAERTLFVWEQHEDFVVRDAEPRCVWIERDDAEIAKLVTLADLVIAELDQFSAELSAW